jgi:hypothetical protein
MSTTSGAIDDACAAPLMRDMDASAGIVIFQDDLFHSGQVQPHVAK